MSKLERWNTHFSTTVEQTVFDIEFQLAQDPSSHNLGTSVWDASIVLAKWLEKNARKGELSRLKVRGKRCIELGAGMGLGGMAFALLGANVVLTDTTEPVLALLKRNADANMTPAALKLKDAAWAVQVAGSVTVTELDWANTSHYEALHPPFDYILAADCVYSETAVPHFLNAVLAMAGPRSLVAICNEFRSQSVHDIFMADFSKHFTIKKVPMNKMDENYRHPLIHIYLMKRKKGGKIEEEEEEQEEVHCALEKKEIDAVQKLKEQEGARDFVTRRQGAALAQKMNRMSLHGSEPPP